MASSNATGEAEAGESTPLVPKIEEWPEDEPPPLKEMKEQSLKERAVAGAGAVCFGASVAAMVVESNPVVYISGALGAAVAPYSVLQQQKMTQTEALRQTNERLGEEISQLKEENVRLQGSVKNLEDSVSNLQDMQKTLEQVRALEGQSLDELEKQVESSRQILSTMQDSLRGNILQGLISIIMTVDIDGSGELSDDEINDLIEKMEHIQGVDLKEGLLRKKLTERGRQISTILDVAKNLLDDDTPQDQNIFNFVESGTF